jgi:hypothetical protein
MESGLTTHKISDELNQQRGSRQMDPLLTPWPSQWPEPAQALIQRMSRREDLLENALVLGSKCIDLSPNSESCKRLKTRSMGC